MQNGMLQLLFRFHAVKNSYTAATELTRILFAYLNAIKTQGITQERYQTFLKRSRAIPPNRSPVIMYVKSLAVHLAQGASFKTILGVYDDTPAFDEHLLLGYLDQLNPTNFNIYETRNIPHDSQIEPWFGLKYSSSKINSSFLKELYSVTAQDYGITLPPSKHISHETSLVNEDTFKTQVEVLANNSIGSIISVNMKTVRDPSVKLQLDFGLHPSPKLLPFLDLLKEISEAYSANESSISSQSSYYFQTEQDSLIFVLRDKQETISKRIIDFIKMLRGFRANWHSFLSSKESFYTFWKDKDFYSEDDIPLTDLPRLLNPYFRDYQQTLAEVSALTPAEFQYCARHMQENLRFILIASGNISSEILIDLKHQIEDVFALNATKLLYENIQPPSLLPGSYVYVEKYQKNNSVILFYLDLFSLGDVPRYAMAQVTKVLISTRFFHQLRTIEQLGYVVEMSLTNQDHMGGLVGIIQGTQSPIYLESRIESFLFYFVQEIKAIPEERLNLTVASIARVLDKPPANIPSGYGFDWEIVQNYLPEAQQSKPPINQTNPPANQTVEFLPTLTKDTFIHFLEIHLLKSSPLRKKLSIHLNHPRLAYAKPTNYTLRDCGYQVQDYTSFHMTAF
ncbi:metalloprotease [Entomophthora muscae]|uniref:Metalloprotease n=1 Tax=Entomophthora muscae TaxID=34485 RepID=A0ACC2T6B2_9FUNG|nr:metalloprotease [Entomophthora muscae]